MRYVSAILISILGGQAGVAANAVLPSCCTSMLGFMSMMDAKTGRIEAQFTTGGIDGWGYDAGMAFTKDGSWAALFSNEYPVGPQAIGITFIELNTGKILGPVVTANAIGGAVAVNPRSGLVYATYTETESFVGHLQEVDPVSLKVLRDVVSDCAGIAVSPDGERIYCNTTSGIEVTAAETLSPIGTILFAGLSNFALSGDGSVLYVASSEQEIVEFVDTSTLQVTNSVSIGARFVGLAVSPDASQLYLPTLTSLLTLNTGTLIVTSIPVVPGFGMLVAPDGTLYWITGLNLVVFDPVSQVITASFPAPEATGTFAMNSAGNQLCFLASGASTISITGKVPSPQVLRSSVAVASSAGAYDQKDASSGEFVGDFDGFSGVADRGIGETYGRWYQRTAVVALS